MKRTKEAGQMKKNMKRKTTLRSVDLYAMPAKEEERENLLPMLPEEEEEDTIKRCRISTSADSLFLALSV